MLYNQYRKNVFLMNKFCTNCGRENPENAAFCAGCGNNLAGGVAPQAAPDVAPVGAASKSKLVAGLLAIFLGGIGVHNFYLGYNDKAIAQLLIFILSCTVFSFVSCIWALIEAVMIFTGSINVDANGVPLKD